MNFEKFTIPQLKAELSRHGVPTNSKMRKADLVQLLNESVAKSVTQTEKIASVVPTAEAAAKIVSSEKKKLTLKKVIPNIPDRILLYLRSRAAPSGEAVSNEDFSYYLRASYFYPEVSEHVFNLTGHHGLPLREGFNLKPVQIEALNFMRDRENTVEPYCGIKGGMLMLNMGVGKTLTGAAYSLASTAARTPTLVVCTKILLDVWYTEIAKFFSNVRVLRLHGDYLDSKEMTTVNVSYFDNYDFVLTTYEFISKHKEDPTIERSAIVLGEEHTRMHGRKITIRMRDSTDIDQARAATATGGVSLFFKKWKRVLFDESQSYASTKTTKYVSVMCIVGEYKWCLTGTPFKNKAEDVFAQFRSIGYIGNDNHEVRTLKEWSGGEAFKTDELNKVIFAKEDEETVLPDLNYNKVEVPFTNHREEEYYNVISRAMNDAINGYINSSITFSEILVVFMRLRQSCITPFLIGEKLSNNKQCNDIDDLIEWSKTPDSKLSSKFKKAVDIIKKVLSNGEQIVVFSSFAESVKIFSEILDDCGISNRIIDGKSKKRDDDINDFKNKKFDVLNLTYKVGSEGLTLTNANHVILLDPWWCDAVHKQAIGRVYRTGQTREVEVYQLFNPATFEQQMIAMCENKNTERNALFCDSSEIQNFNGLKSTGLDFNTIRKIVNKQPSRKPKDEGDICYVCHDSECKDGDKFIHTGCKCDSLIHASCLLEIAAYNEKGKAICTICKKSYKLKK